MIRRVLRQALEVRLYMKLAFVWRKVVRGVKVSRPDSRMLIVPCDPWGVVGSRGDQAMILAVKQHCKGAEIDILTDSHDTDADCREIGLNPLAEWNASFDRWMKDNAGKYKEVYILGADVTDGVYGWPTAMKLLMFYDCFSRLGIKAHYLGFSWSRTPSPWMHLVFPLLKRGLTLPVRDPVSYRRLERFTRHRPLAQVADAAFLLHPNPTPRARKWIDWCREMRKGGRTVVAVNVHQMFNDAETKSAEWEAAFSQCLKTVAENNGDIIYLLVPHDNRPRVSDLKILKRINRLLTGSTLIDVVMNADEIKAVLGECDALIAGRMHISIAALGQGVPVLGLVYQGKFEGLWKHFELSADMLIMPKLFLDAAADTSKIIENFIRNLDSLRTQIRQQLPVVLDLSSRNFILAQKGCTET